MKISLFNIKLSNLHPEDDIWTFEDKVQTDPQGLSEQRPVLIILDNPFFPDLLGGGFGHFLFILQSSSHKSDRCCMA